MRCSTILVITLFAAYSCHAKVDHTRCQKRDTWLGELEELTVDGCQPKEKCLLERGTTKNLTIKFKPNTNIKNVSARVFGVIGNGLIPYDVPNEDACLAGFPCPIQQGETVVYHAGLPVLAIYPQMSLIVRWELVNENRQVIICKMISVKITKRKST